MPVSVPDDSATVDLICNRALRLCGETVTVADIPTDDPQPQPTRQGLLMREAYAPTREALLRAFPWNWNQHRVMLQKRPGESGSNRYKVAWELPDDFIDLRRIEFHDDNDYEIEDGSSLDPEGADNPILRTVGDGPTPELGLEIVYGRARTTAHAPEHWKEALITRLALWLAPTFPAADANFIAQLAHQTFEAAKQVDNHEVTPLQLDPGDWVGTRLRGEDYVPARWVLAG